VGPRARWRGRAGADAPARAAAGAPAPGAPAAAAAAWAAPAEAGAAPVSGYTVLCAEVLTGASPGAQAYRGEATRSTGPGGYANLSPATEYTCTVFASDPLGAGPPSAPSPPFSTPAQPSPPPPPPPPPPPAPPAANAVGVPAAPTISYFGGSQLTAAPSIPFPGAVPSCITDIKTACFANGSPLTQIALSAPVAACGAEPFAVQLAGLAPGTAYTCTAAACNANAFAGFGSVECSAPSAGVSFVAA
jgi:hypothetical protein